MERAEGHEALLERLERRRAVAVAGLDERLGVARADDDRGQLRVLRLVVKAHVAEAELERGLVDRGGQVEQQVREA